MTILLVLALIALLAILAPVFGADSRDLGSGSSLLRDRRLPHPPA